MRNFGGLDKIDTATEKGSHQLFQTDNTYAGLGSTSAHGKGSVFKVQRVLAFVGTGAVRVAGQDIGVSANSSLQYVKKTSGSFAGPAYQAGHARPSSQTIYPKNTPGAGKQGMDGSVATVIWRVDSITGQVSLASLSSNVLVLAGQSVIQPFPAADANGQDYWGIGVSKPGFGSAPVFYELKTDLGGEVAESTLSYSRVISQASITSGDTTLTLDGSTAAADRFSAADIGRRVEIAGKLDSWIVSVTDEFNAETNDDATATATNEPVTVRHAVDGILRAVEISWTAESLVGQNLAPYDAYPPPANVAWGGILNDTMFIEDTDGIIFVGVPAFIGSFPPKNTLFPSEPATAYLDGSDGVYWRFTKSTLSVLTYIGGTKPLELQQVWKNAGVLYPQNAAIGMGGRVIAWSGKPVRLGAGRDPETAFAFKVYKDFEGWDQQTADKPVICAFDPDNQFDIWAYDTKIMCQLASTDDVWCAPIDVSPYLEEGEHLMDAVVVNNKLRFSTSGGAELTLFRFDEGSGSTMKVRTPEQQSGGSSDTVSGIEAIVHVDDTQSITIRVIRNFDDAAPITAKTFTPAATPTNQTLRCRPNIRNAKQHSIEIELDSTGKNCGVQQVVSYGETSGVYID